MVHTDEYLNAECAANLNELTERANRILGYDTVKLQNSKVLEGGIDVCFDGKFIYNPAEEIEADAFLQGIIMAYDKLQSSKKKVYAVVNTYFSANNIGKNDPIIDGVFKSFMEAKIAFEDEKKKIISDGYDPDEVIIYEDKEDSWGIQKNNWDDWDFLKIVELEKTENTADNYIVYKIRLNEENNDNFPDFVCVSGNEKVAKQAFENEKKIIEDEEFGNGDEESYISTNTENEWQINSDVSENWIKIVFKKY